MTTDPDPAEGEVPTLRDRMRAAGLSDERIAVHADVNAIVLDGALVRDLDRPAPPGHPLALCRTDVDTGGISTGGPEPSGGLDGTSETIRAVANSEDHYVLAGVDLRAFVADWVAVLESGGGQSRGLLDHARTDPEVHQRYSYGATYVFANIGKRASEPTASEQELLLFAVLSLYAAAGYPGADRTQWEGEAVHVGRAFAYVAELGDREAGRRLRAEVLRKSAQERPPEFEEMLQNSMDNAPARFAAHDQLMASIDARSFRAAKLLDPAGENDVDAELAALLSGGDHRA